MGAGIGVKKVLRATFLRGIMVMVSTLPCVISFANALLWAGANSPYVHRDLQGLLWIWSWAL